MLFKKVIIMPVKQQEQEKKAIQRLWFNFHNK
jgi:hypothetical protein